MKRGEIYYADLNPAVGSEAAKRRPVLIVSRNANNRAANTLTVIPITSKIERIRPFEVILFAADSGLPKDSKAQAQQIRTIAKERLSGDSVGEVNAELMLVVVAAMKLHLSIE
jgi:mRNA interferase MazF